MLESVLVRKNASVKVKITIKSVIAAMLVLSAVALPQLAHLVGGASAGVKWLPMYLPVLVAGCLLGWNWGLGVGVMSPLASYLLTSAFSNPMPALERLPFMIVELAVFALVSGAFSKKIFENAVFAFPAVLLACIIGRTSFVILAVFFGSVATVWAQIQTGFIGLIAQAAIVPFIIIGLRKLLTRKQ